jgi:hypothetical protein
MFLLSYKSTCFLNLTCIFKMFLLGYIHCTGGFSVTILNRIILYIGKITSIISSSWPPSYPTWSNYMKFLCSISCKYMKSIHDKPSFNVLHSPSALSQVHSTSYLPRYCFMILLMLYHSLFLSLFPQVP